MVKGWAVNFTHGSVSGSLPVQELKKPQIQTWGF
jgi:hypothetical protein